MLLVNREATKVKHIFRECALKTVLTRIIFSPKCTKYRLADAPDPVAGFKEGITAKGSEGNGMVREGRKEWGCKGEYASLAYLGIEYDTILGAYMLREVTVNSLGNPCSQS